jgi:hypothetical protein
MKFVTILRREQKESSLHYIGRKMIVNYLHRLYPDHGLELWTEFPPAQGAQHSDISVISYIPQPRVKIWVEVQTTPLGQTWREKLEKIISDMKNFLDELWILLVGKCNTNKEKEILGKIINEIFRKRKITNIKVFFLTNELEIKGVENFGS